MSKNEQKLNPVKKTNKTVSVKTKKASTPIKKNNNRKVIPKKVINKNLKAKIIEPKKDIVFLDNVSANKCKHCHKFFEKELVICPFCHKNQKDNLGKIVIVVLAIILLLSIIGTHFLNKYYENQVSAETYKLNCKLLSYEDLVRKPNIYKGTNVKIIGKVLKVEGVDVSYGNVMNVTLDANLFEGTSKQLITFEYTDKKYEIGFIEGDLITVYGEYISINGNNPFIKAKYIVFGS